LRLAARQTGAEMVLFLNRDSGSMTSGIQHWPQIQTANPNVESTGSRIDVAKLSSLSVKPDGTCNQPNEVTRRHKGLSG